MVGTSSSMTPYKKLAIYTWSFTFPSTLPEKFVQNSKKFRFRLDISIGDIILNAPPLEHVKMSIWYTWHKSIYTRDYASAYKLSILLTEIRIWIKNIWFISFFIWIYHWKIITVKWLKMYSSISFLELHVGLSVSRRFYMQELMLWFMFFLFSGFLMHQNAVSHRKSQSLYKHTLNRRCLVLQNVLSTAILTDQNADFLTKWRCVL